MASDLKELIKESLGPLPRVCHEQVMLDMERARMTAEDYRQMNRSHVEKINEMSKSIMNIGLIVQWQIVWSGQPMPAIRVFTEILASAREHVLISDDDGEMSDDA